LATHRPSLHAKDIHDLQQNETARRIATRR
jgi:hypothetical protein